MRILITNSALAGRSGTEVFVEQLADGLRRRGHEVILYSPLVGGLGWAMRRRGHLVFGRIADIAQTPDVIHAHHVGPTLAAIAAFPNTPAIFLMHSVEAEFDTPPLHPQIVSYHAVSTFVRAQRASAALPASEIGLVYNAVDLDRFPLKSIRARPERALIVAKYGDGRELIRATCLRLDLNIDEVGPASWRVTSDLAEAFLNADLVFASGRSALEGLASGCAVVLTEGGRFGGLVQRATVGTMLDLNFGVRAMPERLSVPALEAAIGCYNAADTLVVARHVRQARSLERQVDELLTLYSEAALQGRRVGNRDRQLATLIEAYVPSHGDLPWSELARCVADGSLRRNLEALSEANRFGLAEDPLPFEMSSGLHCFGIGNAACSWLKDGWWQPEEWGVWSKTTAHLFVPIGPEITEVSVRYKLFDPGIDLNDPPLVEIGSRKREIILSNQPVGPDGVRELLFDVRPADPSSTGLSLKFIAPCAKSPRELGLSSDERCLGVGLISFTAYA